LPPREPSNPTIWLQTGVVGIEFRLRTAMMKLKITLSGPEIQGVSDKYAIRRVLSITDFTSIPTSMNYRNPNHDQFAELDAHN
jgi:hypothetical protein